MPASPPISVVIVCKNAGPRLHALLASLWAQQEVVPELVVIDGASTDGTREWLETQRARLAVFQSAPDTGIYEAMNKGIAAATGNWLLFLGADDRLATDSVLRETYAHLEKTTAHVVVGEAAYDDGRVYRLSSRLNPIARNFVHHQATFYRRGLFGEHGRFDRSLAIMADYEFNLRLFRSGMRFEALPLRISTCGTGGLSDAGSWRGYREEIAVRHRYFSFPSCLLWDAASVVRFVRKKILRTTALRPQS